MGHIWGIKSSSGKGVSTENLVKRAELRFPCVLHKTKNSNRLARTMFFDNTRKTLVDVATRSRLSTENHMKTAGLQFSGVAAKRASDDVLAKWCRKHRNLQAMRALRCFRSVSKSKSSYFDGVFGRKPSRNPQLLWQNLQKTSCGPGYLNFTVFA